MNPTTELRFVERELPYPEVRTIRVLQQKWEKVEFICDMNRVTAEEWRDVPLVKEEA